MGYGVLNRYDFTLNYLTIIELAIVLSAIVIIHFFKNKIDRKFLLFTATEKSAAVKNKTPSKEEIATDKKKHSVRFKLIRNFKYLSPPLYLTIILILSSICFAALGHSTKLILMINEFSIIWFCLRFLTILSGSKSPKPIAIMIAIVLFMDIFDLTDTAVVTLDRISVDFGGFRLSAFLIIKIISAALVCLWVISLISQITKRFVGNFNLNTSANNITTILIDTALYFVLFLIILKIIGFDITTVAVIGSAIGFGIGFGLQKITSNFISGLILLFERSIKEGDVIELANSPDEIGFVKHFGIRYTLMRTFDNKEIMVPNEDFMTNKVTNWTFSDREVRIKMCIGVSYDTDLNLAKKLMLEAANECLDKGVTHKPICSLIGFGDSSVDFWLFTWVVDVEKVLHSKRSEILFAVWQKFKDNGIEIPFPQQDVHLKNIPDDLKSR